MKRTDAQRVADAQLSEALQAVVTAYQLLPPGSMFNEFLCIVEGIRYPEDSDTFDEFHGLAFRDGQMRRSSGLGLVRIADEILSTSGMYIIEQGGDDDDGAD